MEHVSTMTELGKSENPWNRDDWKKRGTVPRDTYRSFDIELANSKETLYHGFIYIYIFEQIFPIKRIIYDTIYLFLRRISMDRRNVPR